MNLYKACLKIARKHVAFILVRVRMVAVMVGTSIYTLVDKEKYYFRGVPNKIFEMPLDIHSLIFS